MFKDKNIVKPALTFPQVSLFKHSTESRPFSFLSLVESASIYQYLNIRLHNVPTYGT